MKKTIVVLFGLAAALSAPGAVLVYDAFDYTVGETLRSQDGWSYAGAADDAVIADGSLGYSGFNVPSGNSVQLYTNISGNDGTRQVITFDADGRQAGEALYISFLLKVADVGTLSTNNSRFLSYYRTSYYNGVAIRRHAGDSTRFDIALARQVADVPDDIVWDDNGGAGYSEGTTLLVVYGVDDVSTSGANDLKCWINPDSSTFGQTAPTPSLTTEARPATGTDADDLAIGCGNGATVQIDELRIGESYADVTPPDITPRATYFLIN